MIWYGARNKRSQKRKRSSGDPGRSPSTFTIPDPAWCNALMRQRPTCIPRPKSFTIHPPDRATQMNNINSVPDSSTVAELPNQEIAPEACSDDDPLLQTPPEDKPAGAGPKPFKAFSICYIDVAREYEDQHLEFDINSFMEEWEDNIAMFLVLNVQSLGVEEQGGFTSRSKVEMHIPTLNSIRASSLDPELTLGSPVRSSSTTQRETST